MAGTASPDGYETWNEYWTKEHNQPWRTEREIDEERQRYLSERRAVEPDIENGIYPFRGESGNIKLTRADVEWLLVTHVSDGMSGPVDWKDENQRERAGIDLRGADLRHVHLARLPLARALCGLIRLRIYQFQLANILAAGAHFEDADLTSTALQGAQISGARFDRADLTTADLEHAEGIFPIFHRAEMTQANLRNIVTSMASFERATLLNAHLEGAAIEEGTLASSDLRMAHFDASSDLDGIVAGDKDHGWPLVADVRWNGVNLAPVRWTVPTAKGNWPRVHSVMLGDERQARDPLKETGEPKSKRTRLLEFEGAERANRQLAVVLRSQGLNDAANGFAYRAQVLQRQVLRRQRRYGSAVGSWILEVIAGYGYKPMRTFAVYLIALLSFAVAYFILGQVVGPHLSPLGAFVFSMTSFHGRGFFPGGIVLDDPITVLAAFEAFVGLVIEVTFIATFTQRFFAR